MIILKLVKLFLEERVKSPLCLCGAVILWELGQRRKKANLPRKNQIHQSYRKFCKIKDLFAFLKNVKIVNDKE